MTLSLNDRNWKEFNFIDIFNIKCGFYNKKPQSESKGKIPFIGATEYNNGITEFYSYSNILCSSKTGKEPNESIDKKIFKGNCICVTNNGSVGFAYYQKTRFTCTHDVNPLYLKNHLLNKYIAMFIIAAIEKQRVCFMYARKWRPCRMIKSKIMLPVNSKGEPDYKFMEEYIKEREEKLKEKYKIYTKNRIKTLTKNIETKKEWKEFFISDIFKEIKRGKRLVKEKQKQGKVPYISSTSLNNGVDNFISNSENVRFYENCLSLANSGSVGSCFYEPYKFVASDHVTHLKNDFSKYTYLFLACMLNRLSEKYNFNREINDTRIQREKIFLPVLSSSEPDYKYMENYMKYLEQKKILEYLNYIN